jgi:outer membrane lipoprotein SlyB
MSKHNATHFIAATALALAASAAGAASHPADERYVTESKAAGDRYEADKKLCNDEKDSASRLTCRRDAKAEYDAAMATAKAQRNSAVMAQKAGEPACTTCGRVTAVHVVEKKGEAGAVGTVGGGVVGGVLGNQVGGGSGKTLATVAGAVGGALLGREMERRYKAHQVWNVDVQYDNGDKKTFSFNSDPRLGVGDWVKNSGNSIVRN